MAAASLLQMSIFELMDSRGIGEKEAKRLQRQAALSVAPNFVTASTLAKCENQWLNTGLPQLDELIPIGMVTEIVGPPGSGKTQLCLQLLGETANSGSSAVLIDTELSFNAQRFTEMQFARFPLALNGMEPILKNVSVAVALKADDLLLRIDSMDEFLCQRQPPCKLIIIDSFGCVAKKQFDNNFVDRSQFMMKFTAKLKYLATKHHLAVVVVNQITTKLVYSKAATDETDESPTKPKLLSGSIVPALGPTWAHLANVRIALNKHSNGCRELVVLKSPFCGHRGFSYTLSVAGLDIVNELNRQQLRSVEPTSFSFRP